MILANAIVVGNDFIPHRCDLQIIESKIAHLGENLSGDEIVDLEGRYILPGFIDTHIHGAYGVRISDEKPDLHKITQFEATQGVTGICITTASSAFEDILRQFDLAVEAAENCPGSKILGIHAEGPFLSQKYKGAMNPDYIITPDKDKFDRMLQRSKGLLKIITIAPETENAAELIQHAVRQGITVSIGHTNASFAVTTNAILAGATQATHTFNAMRSYNHREPGVLGAVLTNSNVCCEMICDYVHLHPATVQLIYQLKGAEGINMISDSGHAAGLDVTEFEVDGLVRYVQDGVVRLADGTIAGSAKTLLDGVKNLLTAGIPLSEVAKMASYNPAKSMKVDHLTGSITVGKCADLVVLDSNYNVAETYIDGICVYKRT